MEDGSPEVPLEGGVAQVPDGAASDDAHSRNPSFQPGARVADKYLVERLIGEGGLGVVVSAKHIQLDQTVAIKYLRPRALAARGVAERFLREARLSAKIRSDHVVHVYDVGTLADGAPYMVMEHLVGSDLGRQLTATGPLTVERSIDFVLQACEALAEAHLAGIVHRDIKPDNLFVATGSGGKSVLKILDFGISKLSAKRSTSGELRDLTDAGDKFGTPVYMSPEQLLASGGVDARADVWAMGVVFFELLTGKLPFDGDSLPELCTAILNKPPVSLIEARPSIPAPLQAVIERCLEKDVEKRFQNVAELAQELSPFVGSSGQERIDHVVRIVRGGGETVRAATPLPDASSARAMRDVSTLAEPGERALTTGSGAASWGASTSPRTGDEARRHRTRLVAFGVAVGVAVALFVAALTGHRSPEGGVATSAPAAPATGSAPAGLAAEPPTLVEAVPAPAEDEAIEHGEVSDPNAPAAAASSVAATLHAPPKAPKAGAGPKGRGSARPTHADPNAVINPFE